MWRSRKSRVWEAVPETACGSYTALPTLLSRVSSMRCVLFLFPNLRTWQSSHYLSFTQSHSVYRLVWSSFLASFMPRHPSLPRAVGLQACSTIPECPPGPPKRGEGGGRWKGVRKEGERERKKGERRGREREGEGKGREHTCIARKT